MHVTLEVNKRDLECIINHRTCYNNATNSWVKQKVQKEFVVMNAHAVTDPGTMMVHSHYTSIAYTAVMSTRWSERNAFEAITPVEQWVGVCWKVFSDLVFNHIPLLVRHSQNILLDLLLTSLSSDSLKLNTRSFGVRLLGVDQATGLLISIEVIEFEFLKHLSV